MAKETRIVTLKADGPDYLMCGLTRLTRGEPVRVECDTDEREGRERLAAFENEPCVMVETEEDHKKRTAKATGKPSEGSGGGSAKSSG